MPSAQNAVQLRITLKHIRPPIWRRVVVPDNYTLGQLHGVIQVTMGWYHCHLHVFQVPRRGFGPPLRQFGTEAEDENENTAWVYEVLSRKGQKLYYQYDFGDNWEHDILVEKLLPFDAQARYPVCLAGARACPPEDCGGIPGYYGVLKALQSTSKTAGQKEFLEWLGDRYDPERFDLEAVNSRLGGKR